MRNKPKTKTEYVFKLNLDKNTTTERRFKSRAEAERLRRKVKDGEIYKSITYNLNLKGGIWPPKRRRGEKKWKAYKINVTNILTKEKAK